MSRWLFSWVLSLFVISSFFSISLYSLKRDEYGCNVEKCLDHVCPKHLREIQDKYDIVVNDKEVNYLLPLFPRINVKCDECRNKAIYKGYFDIYISRYFNHLKSYLSYCEKNSECKCYWPELSPLAAQINDLAYDLFDEVYFQEH